VVACPVCRASELEPQITTVESLACRWSKLHFLAPLWHRRAKYQRLAPGFSSIRIGDVARAIDDPQAPATLIWPAESSRRAVRGTLESSSWTTEGEASRQRGCALSRATRNVGAGARLGLAGLALAAGAAASREAQARRPRDSAKRCRHADSNLKPMRELGWL